MEGEAVELGRILEWSQPLHPKTSTNGEPSSSSRSYTGTRTSSRHPNAANSNPFPNPSPTIKNHSTTYHNGYLYCFGGYDGRFNHMTMRMYSIAEKRWSVVPYLADSATGRNEVEGEEVQHPSSVNDPFAQHWFRQESPARWSLYQQRQQG